MFKLRLATGEEFEVTTAEQLRSSLDGMNDPRMALRVEAVPAPHGLEWYLEKLNAPGALDTVEVLTPGGAVGFSVEGYTDVANVSVRLLATGDRELALVLCKPRTA